MWNKAVLCSLIDFYTPACNEWVYLELWGTTAATCSAAASNCWQVIHYGWETVRQKDLFPFHGPQRVFRRVKVLKSKDMKSFFWWALWKRFVCHKSEKSNGAQAAPRHGNLMGRFRLKYLEVILILCFLNEVRQKCALKVNFRFMTLLMSSSHNSLFVGCAGVRAEGPLFTHTLFLLMTNTSVFTEVKGHIWSWRQIQGAIEHTDSLGQRQAIYWASSDGGRTWHITGNTEHTAATTMWTQRPEFQRFIQTQAVVETGGQKWYKIK